MELKKFLHLCDQIGRLVSYFPSTQADISDISHNSELNRFDSSHNYTQYLFFPVTVTQSLISYFISCLTSSIIESFYHM